MITGLLHAAITVSDMERSLALYRDLLGGQVIFEFDKPEGQPFAVCVKYADGSCVELFYPRPAEFPLGKELGKIHFCLITDDMDTLVADLTRHGLEITQPPKIALDNNLQLWFRDPDGYPVEVMQLMPNNLQGR